MKQLELLSIAEHLEDNQQFIDNPLCQAGLFATIEFYKKVGFVPPWIGYFVKEGDLLVGAAGFKGKPINGTVEVAYGTFDQYQKQGIGTAICRALVDLARNADPSVRITARTLPQNNYSTKVLQNNSFERLGTVNDPEDGEVWEWEFRSESRGDAAETESISLS